MRHIIAAQLGERRIMENLKKRILQILQDNKDDIAEKFEVKSLALFGSVVRETANAESDIDILIEYYNTPGLFRFIELKNHLEMLTGRHVDLVTNKALKKQIREQILHEAVHVS